MQMGKQVVRFVNLWKSLLRECAFPKVRLCIGHAAAVGVGAEGDF